MVSVCLPSGALLQHLPSYLGFSYLGHGVSLHGCSSKAQPLLLTLDKVPHIRGQGQWLRGATPCLRSGAAAERNNPMSKEQWLRGRRRAERSYSMFKVRRGDCEEIPLVQGKEQRLCFAGAVVKRYRTSKVRETQARR